MGTYTLINVLLTIILAFFNFIIAFYGALLSTGLLIHEIRKGRKKLTIFLDYVDVIECFQILISNTGYRTITITGISMEYLIKNGEKTHWNHVSQGEFLNMEASKYPFPATIKDGESVTFFFAQDFSVHLMDYLPNIRIIIYDTEGNEYSKYSIRRYDVKFGSFYEYT